MIYSIWHSNHDIIYFCSLLQKYKIELLIDVRKTPFSRYNPHFNKKWLELTLNNLWINYKHFYWLWWWHDTTEEYQINFSKEINELIQLQKNQRTCIMCSEWDPRILKTRKYECHRLCLLTPVLADQDIEVVHILPNWDLI